MALFIHSFNKYLLSTCFVPRKHSSGSKDIAVNKIGMFLPYMSYAKHLVCDIIILEDMVQIVSLFKYFFNVFIIVLGVHCDIYKSSYNIPSLNSPPPPFSFIPPSSYSWNCFNRSHFSLCIHV
jgi:hypothetical protein